MHETWLASRRSDYANGRDRGDRGSMGRSRLIGGLVNEWIGREHDVAKSDGAKFGGNV
jgi:hypothetical protein